VLPETLTVAEYRARPISNIPARVLIAEDNPLFLEYLSHTVGQQSNLVMVGAVKDGLSAIRSAECLQPDLVLLDIGLPGLNGIDAARQIRQLAPQTRIVFVTQESSRDVIEEALKTGASGYVLKTRAQQDLLAALANVCRGEKFVSHGLSTSDLASD
jgi:DNA-binding NarL/FixJ family response regulator